MKEQQTPRMLEIDESCSLLVNSEDIRHAEKTIDKIRDAVIRENSHHGNEKWLFRGEPECYPNTSSTLFRKYPIVDPVKLSYDNAEQPFKIDYNKISRDYVRCVSETVGDSNDEAVESRFRHVGGLSNKIDFTIDLNVALFFACRDSLEANGRLLMLYPESDDGDWLSHLENGEKVEISKPAEKDSATGVQRSVLIGHPRGYLPKDSVATREFIIPAKHKRGVLKILKAIYGIDESQVFPRLEDMADRSKKGKLLNPLMPSVQIKHLADKVQLLLKGGLPRNKPGDEIFDLIKSAIPTLQELSDAGYPYYVNEALWIENIAKKLGILKQGDKDTNSKDNDDKLRPSPSPPVSVELMIRVSHDGNKNQNLG